MKKYLPITLVIILSLIVILPQVTNVFQSVATPSKTEQKINSHYENNLKKLDFTNLEGKKFSKEELSNNVVILNFWASWCKPCIQEFPTLVSLRKKFPKEKLTILAINSDKSDTKKVIKKTIDKYGLNFDIVPFGEGKITNEYRIEGIPVTILYRNGKVERVFNGEVDFNSEEFLENLKDLLKR